jgi:hypothetical protein
MFQNDINRAFIETFNEAKIPDLVLTKFFLPNESYKNDIKVTDLIKVGLPLIMMLSAFFSASKIIKVSLIRY